MREVIENGGGSCKGVMSRDLTGDLVKSYSSLIEAGGEENKSGVEFRTPAPRSSSCRLKSFLGRGLLLVVDVDDARSCSYAALDRSESSKEKLLVWCRKLRGL